MRTLVISDLHLGNRPGNDVLRLPGPRERLLDALETVDRLVLLGDTVELVTRDQARAMRRAQPIVRAIGQRLGRGREVILVPGNHDLVLIREWLRERGAELGLAETIDPSVSPVLQTVVDWLGPAEVTVRYPGVWLENRVWLNHGHYLDQHLLPESAFGLQRGRLLSRQADAARPWEYEHRRRSRRRRRRPSESLLGRLRHRPVATLMETTAEMVRRATMPQLPVALMHARLAPVTAAAIDAQMRHNTLAAMALVARRLGVDADWVVFGHVHRLGPRDGDRWPDGGAPRLLNTGSWLYEPLLVDRAAPPHPYWPGGAVMIEDGGPPRAVGLLDDLPIAALIDRGG